MPGGSARPMSSRLSVPVNGRVFRWPERPVTVICFDGCDPAYIDAASAAGRVPAIDRIRREGFAATALAVMPTFTNPNNLSIVCGAPPSVHGVSGNYHLDVATGRAVMMLDAALVRAPTILARFAEAGADVAVVTAKDKLRRALGHGLSGIAFSAEKARDCAIEEHGIEGVESLVGRPTPAQYSADLSLFVLDAGIRLLETRRPDLLYLSLSDYVQHVHAPGTSEADAFMEAVDRRIAALVALGATVGIVADHGMTDMATPEGAPNVLYLGDVLDEVFGEGGLRVICPITDPFVRHHGALGGFVRVHLMRPGIDRAAVMRTIAELPGIAEVLSREEACRRFELPPDREADIAVVAARGVAIGARAADHDLAALDGQRLRSHGSLAEQAVPFLLSHPLTPAYTERARAGLRNFDIFDFAINGVE